MMNGGASGVLARPDGRDARPSAAQSFIRRLRY